MISSHRNALPLVAVAITLLLWASAFVAIRHLGHTFSPGALSLGRLLVGSVALLAEAGHSAADSINEMLLGVSLRHARRPADPHHPLGHESARFLWAFLAAISSFLIGGCLSIALAVRELLEGTAIERYLVGWIVLLTGNAANQFTDVLPDVFSNCLIKLFLIGR